ncbi:MAG: TIGR03087 family PEP-CTERM/XrtA system glycosyltransferase [Sulfuriferula sp.]
MEELLFLAHRIPYPPNKGDKIRSYHLLKHLTERYRVHLGCFVDDQEDWQYTSHLQAICDETFFAAIKPRRAKLKSLTGLISGKPLTLPYYAHAGMQNWVTRTLSTRKIAKIFMFSSAMGQFVPRDHALHSVVDFVDVDSGKWTQYAQAKRWPLSWLYRREGRTLLRWERDLAARSDTALFVSEAEARHFAQLAPESAAHVDWFNNGVDFEYFSPDRHYANPYPADSLPLVFTGAMDYWPNVDAVVWFAREIFPRIRAHYAKARFVIVGGRPGQVVRDLAQLPGVAVTGRVEDVRPWLHHARLAVAPLRIARGVQNKVLEAMAMALPVVASAQALEGIQAVPGCDLLVADGATGQVEQAIAILGGAYPGMGAAARAAVRGHYAWPDNLRRVDALLNGRNSVPIQQLPVAQVVSLREHRT